MDVDGATLDVVNTIAIGDYVSVTATSIRSSDVWGRVTTTFAESGADGNVSVDPVLLDDPLHLDTTSPVVDAGDGSLLDPDGSASDMGFHGGPGAGGYDGDGDGWPNWWLPGAYDASTSAGYDCDDADATAWPGSGC